MPTSASVSLELIRRGRPYARARQTIEVSLSWSGAEGCWRSDELLFAVRAQRDPERSGDFARIRDLGDGPTYHLALRLAGSEAHGPIVPRAILGTGSCPDCRDHRAPCARREHRLGAPPALLYPTCNPHTNRARSYLAFGLAKDWPSDAAEAHNDDRQVTGPPRLLTVKELDLAPRLLDEPALLELVECLALIPLTLSPEAAAEELGMPVRELRIQLAQVRGQVRARRDSQPCPGCNTWHSGQREPLCIWAVRERDGGRCWLCGWEVDMSLSPRHRFGPTLDHVIPESAGGTRDPANVRLAHRECNEFRGVTEPELVGLAGVLAPPHGRARPSDSAEADAFAQLGY
jgi:hypothetical protein